MLQRLQPGTALGTYRVMEPIGQGGMAVVYKAHHAALDRYVAIKVLSAGAAGDAEFLARFQREARAVARLRHPHILEVFDFGEHEGQLYLVMEYLSGGTLADRLARWPERLAPGGVPEALLVEAGRLAEQLGNALDYAHSHGLVHRDLKPTNVFLTEDGSYVLGDFGLAQLLAASVRLTRSGEAWGSPLYMSPEQAQGLPVGPRSDVYSLAAVLYELLTGRPPFEAETPWATLFAHVHRPPALPSEHNPSLPPGVDAALLCALAKEPLDRYATAGALARDLAAALHGESLAAMPPATSRVEVMTGDAAPDQAAAVRDQGKADASSPWEPAGLRNGETNGETDGEKATPVLDFPLPAPDRPAPGPHRSPTVLFGLGLVLLVTAVATALLAAGRIELLGRPAGAPGAGEPPELVEWSPPSNAEGVPLRPTFVLTFNQPMDQRSVQEALALHPPLTLPPGFEWQNRGRKLLATPKEDLLPDTVYTLTLESQAHDRLNHSLASEIRLQFTTGPAPVIAGAAATGTAAGGATSPPETPPPATETPLPLPTPSPSPAPTDSPPAAPTDVVPVPLAAEPSPMPRPLPSHTPEPTPTPTPAWTPTRIPASPTPTRRLLPMPTATPTQVPLGCAVFPVRGFGRVWEENIGVRATLGCARADEAAAELTEQLFERGLMLWRASAREIVVLFFDLQRDPSGRAGRWQSYRDTYQGGEPEPTVAPPPDRLVPVRSLGKVWREQPGVREQLGFALRPERTSIGVVQLFEGGRMVGSGDEPRFIWVLAAAGTYTRYPDPWRG